MACAFVGQRLQVLSRLLQPLPVFRQQSRHAVYIEDTM
jgi:hypothetical protein